MKRENEYKQKVVETLKSFGYVIPRGAKFYKVADTRTKYNSYIGMKIGEFQHSCHVDTTDFVVLLLVDCGNIFVEYFDEFGLEEVK